MFKLFILIVPFLLFKSFFTLHFFCHSAFSPCISPFEGDNIPLRFRSSPPLKGGWGDVLLRSVICHSERSFCYFWLDPKVTQRSRLRALHTPSRRLQAGKSGNSLRSDSLIFFRPARCSVGSPPEARGDERRSVRGEIPHCVRNDKGTSKSIFIQAFSPPPRGLPCFFPNASFHCALG